MKTKKFTSKLLKEIMKKYNLEEGSKIDLELINEIAEKERIKLKDLTCMLQISNRTMRSLNNEKQRTTRIKLDKFIGLPNRKIKVNEKIDYKEFMNLQKEYKLKPYTLIRRLGIPQSQYEKLKSGTVAKVRIKDMRVKHIVDLIKIDLEYTKKYENWYCPEEDLKKICRQRKIKLDEFALYFDNNYRYYKFNKMAIKNNEKGFYIGGECKMDKEFFKDNEEQLINGLKKVANKVGKIVGNKSYNEDLVQETILNLWNKCGHIVKKFYFDIKLTFNILMAKAKYIMFNIYRKEYREQRNIHYDGFEDGVLEHSSLFRDDTYNPELLLD